MKLTSKRLLSILLCLAFVLAMLPMAAMAADTVTVYYYNGASNWAAVNVYYWGSADTNPSWPGNAMTDMGNGYWSAEIPADLAGKEGVIFNNGNGSQTGNLTLPTDGKNCYAGADWIEYTGGDIEIETAYYVAGDAGLCGSAWNPGDAANKMTEAADGKYYKEYENVAAGTYNLKVTDGTWNNAWGPEGNVAGSGNLSITAAEGDTVVVCFDPAGEGTATVYIKGSDPVEPPVPEVNYYVAGDEALTGYAWDAAGAVMTALDDGTYAVTFSSVAAGDYQFKITDGTWDNSWGLNGGNYEITVEAAGDVTITFNPADGSVSYTGAIETPAEPIDIEYINVVGEGSGNWLNGENWAVDSWVNGMIPASDVTDFTVYTATYNGIAAGTYEVKFAANGSWDLAWATGEAMESGVTYDAWFKPLGNSTFTVAEDDSTVTLVLDLTNMDPVTGAGATTSVTVEAPAAVVVPENVVLGDNTYTVIDNTPAAGTFTATQTGILTITPTALTEASMGECPAGFIAGQFGRGNFAIVVNGEVYANAATVSLEVKAGQTYEIGIVNNMNSTATVTLTLTMESYDVKAQISGGTTSESESTNLRLVSWVSSLDMQSVAFNVTINGKTTVLECTAVYEAIAVSGMSVDNAAEVFGNEDAKYFVTYCIDGIPNAAFNTEIEVSVTWTNAEGNVTTSATRTIVIADGLAA